MHRMTETLASHTPSIQEVVSSQVNFGRSKHGRLFRFLVFWRSILLIYTSALMTWLTVRLGPSSYNSIPQKDYLIRVSSTLFESRTYTIRSSIGARPAARLRCTIVGGNPYLSKFYQKWTWIILPSAGRCLKNRSKRASVLFLNALKCMGTWAVKWSSAMGISYLVASMVKKCEENSQNFFRIVYYEEKFEKKTNKIFL